MSKKLLNDREVSEDYGFSVPWLRRARREDTGPPFLRIGRRMIRYRTADIEAFIARQVVKPGDLSLGSEDPRA